jgi:hypothetical protein
MLLESVFLLNWVDQTNLDFGFVYDKNRVFYQKLQDNKKQSTLISKKITSGC